MFENFELKRVSNEDRIIGYHWPKDNPKGVVILIHGIGEHDGRYDRVAGYFNDANFAMIGMDLRGHGKSMGPKGHCAPRAEVFGDMDELIEYAEIRYPGKPLILYGHSMGGNIAMDYRHRGKYNDKMTGYIITSPWLILASLKIPGAAIPVLKGICKFAPRIPFNTSVATADLGNMNLVGSYDTDPLVHHRVTLQTAYDGYFSGKEMAAGIHENDGRAKDVPLLLMAGTADKICDVNGARSLAEHEGDACTYVEWEGYFHELHNGNKEVDGEEAILRMVEYLKSLV